MNTVNRKAPRHWKIFRFIKNFTVVRIAAPFSRQLNHINTICRIETSMLCSIVVVKRTRIERKQFAKGNSLQNLSFLFLFNYPWE